MVIKEAKKGAAALGRWEERQAKRTGWRPGYLVLGLATLGIGSYMAYKWFKGKPGRGNYSYVPYPNYGGVSNPRLYEEAGACCPLKVQPGQYIVCDVVFGYEGIPGQHGDVVVEFADLGGREQWHGEENNKWIEGTVSEEDTELPAQEPGMEVGDQMYGLTRLKSYIRLEDGSTIGENITDDPIVEVTTGVSTSFQGWAQGPWM